MTKRSLPTPEELRQLLRYEPDTGRMYWKARPVEMFENYRLFRSWNAKWSGKEAGSCNGHGYLRIPILGRRLLVHRIAWAMHYNSWPESEVDHINVVRNDNRICNLRLADKVKNGHNRMPPANNVTGVKGVSWHKGGQKWQAYINCGKGRRYLGLFSSFNDAVQARVAASAEMREFAREF